MKTIVDGEEVAGRLISVQFYLKNSATDELIEMDTVGPVFPED